MSEQMHIGWGDSLCGEYDMYKEGSSTLFPDKSTCEKCLAIHKATLKPSLQSTIEAQAAEIAELKDEVENLNDELMFRPKYSTLTERIAELNDMIQALADRMAISGAYSKGSLMSAIEWIKWAKTKAKDATP